MCQRDPADPTSVPVTLDDSQCTQEQPDTHMVCRLDPCADGSNAHRMVEVEVGSCIVSSGCVCLYIYMCVCVCVCVCVSECVGAVSYTHLRAHETA